MQKQLAVLFGIFVLSVLFRWWMISDRHVYFSYDQARDAYVSQQIFTQRDLKIQGPSASGTNDTIYHGVLYYYLIGPLYILLQGNPYLVSLVFAVINSLAILLAFKLAKVIFENQSVAILSAVLVAINFEHAQYSVWLSNPALALLPLLGFFWCVWQIFYQSKVQPWQWWAAMGLTLGVISQSAFYAVFYWGAILVGAYFAYQTNNKLFLKKYFSWKKAAAFLLTYLMTISSMLLAQFKLFQAGIFTPQTFLTAVAVSPTTFSGTTLFKILKLYAHKFESAVTPQLPVIAAGIFLILLWFGSQKTTKSQKWFLLSWLTAPLWLFIFHFRGSAHTLVGMEYPMLMLAAVSLVALGKQKILQKTIALSILVWYLLAQVWAVQSVRLRETSIFTSQTGVLLTNELALIDETYGQANGQPFSVSIWSAPYEYYIGWAYLYDWYGQNTYGYKPVYFGTSQVGKFGPKLLPLTDRPLPTHFLIEEPGVILVGDIYQDFIQRQDAFSNSQLSQFFGEYRLQSRTAK